LSAITAPFLGKQKHQITMPRTPSFRVADTDKGWLLHVPASLSETGKLQRRYFKTRDEAVKAAAVMREGYRANGEQACVLPPRVADQAVAALKLLEGTGGSLLDAAAAFREAWLARNSSMPLADAVAVYLESREDLREVTLASYRYTLEKACEPLAERMLSELTAADVEAITAGKGQTAAAMHRRNFRAFWRWACKPPREWARAEMLGALEQIRQSKDSDIVSLKPAEVRALLKAAEGYRPEAAVAFAVAIFGGVRAKELSRLTWGDVLADHIEIGRSVAKKHARRLVPICSTLRAWLDAYRGESKKDDPLTGGNWRAVSCAVRRLAGWDVSAQLLTDPPEPSRGAWPANACRHTCASVQVAIGTPLEDLTFKFGHSGGHELLRAHYVARMTKKDALAILSTGPGGTTVKQIKAA
jgi:integrase